MHVRAISNSLLIVFTFIERYKSIFDSGISSIISICLFSKDTARTQENDKYEEVCKYFIDALRSRRGKTCIYWEIYGMSADVPFYHTACTYNWRRKSLRRKWRLRRHRRYNQLRKKKKEVKNMISQKKLV